LIIRYETLMSSNPHKGEVENYECIKDVC
jgi:hypothetical protein